MRPHRACVVLLPLLLAAAPTARAQDAAFTLTLKDHKFVPAELEVPANVRIKLTVKNEDPTPAEFESHDFKAERVIPGGREVTLTIGPLKPGTYGFVDEYREKDTKGRLIAK
jgi:uncharacterized protein (DUF58 family)